MDEFRLDFQEENSGGGDKPKKRNQDSGNAAFMEINHNMEEMLRLAELMQKSKDENQETRYGVTLLQKTNQLYFTLREHLQKSNALKTDIEAFSVKASVSREGEVTHIVFDKLIPKRLKSGYDNSHYIWDQFRNALYTAVDELRKEGGKIDFYGGRVVLCYIHCFSKARLTDYDNINTKPVTDAISACFLKDDSPKHVAKYEDYKIGTSDHTEVYLVPVERFPVFAIDMHFLL